MKMGILNDLQLIIEGISVGQEEMMISIKTTEFTKEMSDAIQKTPFKFKDKDGNKQDGGLATVYGRKKNDGECMVISIRVPEGSSASALKAINGALKPLKVSAKKVTPKKDEPIHIQK